MFADALPTGAIDDFMQNAPLDPLFNTSGGFISPAQTGAFGTACASNRTLDAMSAAANTNFKANYAAGNLGCAVPGANPATCVPAFGFYNANAGKVPIYYKWSLEVQRDIGWHTTLNVLYVGNHGSREEFSNPALNAWCCTPNQLMAKGGPFAGPGFANLPTSVPDARFGVVSDANNVGNSNYHGLTLTANHSFSGGLQFQASYTWSHALDEISNNSLSPFGLNQYGYVDAVTPQNPTNLRGNYGNADYDVRHNFVMNYVWSDAFRHLTHGGPNALVKGWTFSGTLFAHTGLPFTIVSSADSNELELTNFGNVGGQPYIFAGETGSPASCGASAAAVTPTGLAADPCATLADFPNPTATYLNQGRNVNRGPAYFDTDFAVEKAFGLPKLETAQFSLGARFFNLFNHPNFNFPIMLNGASNFGQIVSTVSTPTSIYGSGLGADASPRIIQLEAKFQF